MSRRGFGTLRRLPSGRYQASHMYEGSRYTAPYTFTAKMDANAWLAARQTEISRGEWPPSGDVPAAPPMSPTFAEYAAECLAGRPLTGRTPETYAQILRDHLYPTFGDLRLRAITAGRVRRWYDAAGRVTGRTARARAYGLLASVLRQATDDGLIPASPCHIRGAGDSPRQRDIEPATPYEIDAIATAMPGRLRMMVELAAWCQMRFGELAELRRRDIDMDAGEVRIRRAVVWLRTTGAPLVKEPKTKAGKRDVAIPPHLLPALANHLTRHVLPGRDALLFPAGRDRRAHIPPATVRQPFHKARAAAGRPDLRFHDLRHTGATMLAQEGATLGELMGRLGHTTPQMAMRYQHATRERDRALAAALSRRAGTDELSARRGAR